MINTIHHQLPWLLFTLNNDNNLTTYMHLHKWFISQGELTITGSILTVINTSLFSIIIIIYNIPEKIKSISLKHTNFFPQDK